MRAVVGMLCAALLLAAAPAFPGQAGVRPAVMAGTWYPGAAKELGAEVDRLLAAAPTPPLRGRVLALVVPHAGHVYSGGVAAAAWAQAARLRPRPPVVILVGPSHHFALKRPSIWPDGSYACPLGPVPVDQELAAQLAKAIPAGFQRRAHLEEHSLEVQIPFLRRALPNARLVAVLTGRPDPAAAARLGSALAAAARRSGALLVASSDLSHFHDVATARTLDDRVAGAVRRLDPDRLWELALAGKAEACGLQAVMAVMHAARELGADRGEILARADSSEVTGDEKRVVGYLAAALMGGAGPAAATAPAGEPQQPMGLGKAQRRALIDLARRSVEAAVRGKTPPSPPAGDAALDRPAACFVTLKRGGRLRGCIGTIRADRPLAQAVIDMARAAALDDPRFAPVSVDELGGLSLEISVLTPPEPCRPDQVRVGRDGLILRLGRRGGLLLPQVPVELGWDRARFLEGMCQKAGLPPGSWRDPHARLWRFSAVVFK